MIGFSQSNDDHECQWICVMCFLAMMIMIRNDWFQPIQWWSWMSVIFCDVFFSHDDHDKEWLVSANPMMIMNVSDFLWCFLAMMIMIMNDLSQSNDDHWLVVWNIFSIIYGLSSSQLTNSIIFQRGRYTTNQIMNVSESTTINRCVFFCDVVCFFALLCEGFQAVGTRMILTRMWFPPDRKAFPERIKMGYPAW